MMVVGKWILIIALTNGYGMSHEKIEGFTTREECIKVALELKTKKVADKYHCIIVK